jgi:hypothetical protein
LDQASNYVAISDQQTIMPIVMKAADRGVNPVGIEEADEPSFAVVASALPPHKPTMRTASKIQARLSSPPSAEIQKNTFSSSSLKEPTPGIKRKGNVSENILQFESHPTRFIHRTAVRSLNIGTLVEQWLVHMFFPLSLPYLDKVYGPQAKGLQLLEWGFKGDVNDLFRYTAHAPEADSDCFRSV